MIHDNQHPAIVRLQRLRKGDTYVFYKGDFEKDMARSRKESPTYARVLRELFLEVLLLRRAGKITTTKKPRGTRKKDQEYDYEATGL